MKKKIVLGLCIDVYGYLIIKKMNYLKMQNVVIWSFQPPSHLGDNLSIMCASNFIAEDENIKIGLNGCQFQELYDAFEFSNIYLTNEKPTKVFQDQILNTNIDEKPVWHNYVYCILCYSLGLFYQPRKNFILEPKYKYKQIGGFVGQFDSRSAAYITKNPNWKPNIPVLPQPYTFIGGTNSNKYAGEDKIYRFGNIIQISRWIQEAEEVITGDSGIGRIASMMNKPTKIYNLLSPASTYNYPNVKIIDSEINQPIKIDSIKPKIKPKIAIISMADDRVRSDANLAWSNHKKYAKLYGYDVKHYDKWITNKLGASKTLSILENITTYDYLLFLDFDAIFARFDVALESIIEEDKDFYACCDRNGFNAGVMLIKCNETCRKFFERVSSTDETRYHYLDQGIMAELFSQNYPINIKWLDKKVWNAYINSTSCPADYVKGESFIVHWAGIGNPTRRNQMEGIINGTL